MKNSLMLIPAFIICLFVNNSIAQKKVIDIWDAKIPGSIESPYYAEDTLRLQDGKIRIERVIKPTLTIYPAPKEISNGCAAVICPGGGYTRLAIDNEGEGLVKWLNDAGITAAVLKYRLPNDTIMKDKTIGPLQDAQKAIRILRKNAQEFNIAPDKIGIFGFSAGGHLASTASVRFDDKIYDAEDVSARPDFSVLVYPVISMKKEITHKGSSDCLLGKSPSNEIIEKFSNELNVKNNTPPTFIVHAADDKTVPVQNSIDYFTALKKKNIAAELHIYQSGGHGFSMAKSRKTTENQWPNSCLLWLKDIGMVK